MTMVRTTLILHGGMDSPLRLVRVPFSVAHLGLLCICVRSGPRHVTQARYCDGRSLLTAPDSDSSVTMTQDTG